MENEKTDRRVHRTRKLIHEAMVSLMLEKGYEKITIQDIIDRANIGRSTFYAHYQDKEDLLLRGVAEIAYGEAVEEAVSEDIEQLDRAQIFDKISTVNMFTHVKVNERIHQIMFNKSENSILEKGTAFLYENIKAQIERLVEDGQEPAVPVSTLAVFLTGGLMSLTRWWLENDFAYSPQQMDELFQQIAMPGVREVLRVSQSIRFSPQD